MPLSPARMPIGYNKGMSTRLPSQEELKCRFLYKEGQLYYRTRASRRCKPGDLVGSVGGGKRGGYRQTIVDGVQCKVHRLIWKWHYGTEPALIDHINGDRLDNRIENLREATNRENGWNRKAKRDLPPGVYRHQGKYRVRLYLGKPNVSVGMFATLDEAIAARDSALASYAERSSD